MFGALTQAFSRGDINPVSPGGLGFDPNIRMQSGVPGRLRHLSRLPARVSQRVAEQESYRASNLEGSAKLLQVIAAARRRQMAAAVRIYGTQAQHHASVLNADQRMSQIDERLGRQTQDYLLGKGTTKESLSGYQAAFRDADALLS